MKKTTLIVLAMLSLSSCAVTFNGKNKIKTIDFRSPVKVSTLDKC